MRYIEQHGGAYIEAIITVPLIFYLFIATIDLTNRFQAVTDLTVSSRDMANVAFHRCRCFGASPSIRTACLNDLESTCLPNLEPQMARLVDAYSDQFINQGVNYGLIISVYSCQDFSCSSPGDPNGCSQAEPCTCSCSGAINRAIYQPAQVALPGGAPTQLMTNIQTKFDVNDFSSGSLRSALEQRGELVISEAFIKKEAINGLITVVNDYASTIY